MLCTAQYPHPTVSMPPPALGLSHFHSGLEKQEGSVWAWAGHPTTPMVTTTGHYAAAHTLNTGFWLASTTCPLLDCLIRSSGCAMGAVATQ